MPEWYTRTHNPCNCYWFSANNCSILCGEMDTAALNCTVGEGTQAAFIPIFTNLITSIVDASGSSCVVQTIDKQPENLLIACKIRRWGTKYGKAYSHKQTKPTKAKWSCRILWEVLWKIIWQVISYIKKKHLNNSHLYVNPTCKYSKDCKWT